MAADDQIGWRTAPAGLPPLGWEWRYLLEPVDAGTTRVTLTYDWTGTSEENLDRYGVPAFSESKLANSLELLARSLYRRLGLVQTRESDSEYPMRWEQSPTGAPVNPAE